MYHKRPEWCLGIRVWHNCSLLTVLLSGNHVLGTYSEAPNTYLSIWLMATPRTRPTGVTGQAWRKAGRAKCSSPPIWDREQLLLRAQRSALSYEQLQGGVRNSIKLGSSRGLDYSVGLIPDLVQCHRFLDFENKIIRCQGRGEGLVKFVFSRNCHFGPNYMKRIPRYNYQLSQLETVTSHIF